MAIQVKIKNQDETINKIVLDKDTPHISLQTRNKYLSENIGVELTGYELEDATAIATDILSGKTAYVSGGGKITGSISTYDNTVIPSIPKITVIEGGTATNVDVLAYTSSEETAFQTELSNLGYFAEELENAIYVNITGTTPGTIILDVSNCGDVGDKIRLLHKKSDSTWEVLFNGEIPDSKQITITVTEFSPLSKITGISYLNWIINNSPDYLTFPDTVISGTSNSFNFTSMNLCSGEDTDSAGTTLATDAKAIGYISSSDKYFAYGNITPTGKSTGVQWASDNYKIVQFATEPSGTLMDWLMSNANRLKAVVNKPTNLNPTIEYTGSVITNGYTTPTGVIMVGTNSGTETGTYTATYTPDAGYYWSDGTQDTVTVTLKIIPAYFAGLTFTANVENVTIAMNVSGTPTLNQNFQTSTNGVTWTEFIPGTTTITLSNIDDKVYFKGNNPNGISEVWGGNYIFVIPKSCRASGNIMSLIDNGSCTCTTMPCNYCFFALFDNCNITTAPELPSLNVTQQGYQYLFRNTKITTAPSMPATTYTGSYCCYSMFGGCSLLTTPPALPATTLVRSAYSYMFYGCSSLIVSDTPGEGYNVAWTIPVNGTFTNSTSHPSMFAYCPVGSGRASSDVSATKDTTVTYYTQNTPV